MKNKSKPITRIASFLIFILLSSNTNSAKAQKHEGELEFDYIEGSNKGPSQWGFLKEEWATCKDGEMQSPIDISGVTLKVIRKPDRRNYKPANATLENMGTEIQVQWAGAAGSIFVDNIEYPLQEVHWHSPSEHTIYGIRFPLELHMVHKNAQNETAIVGMLYVIGLPDPFLTKLMGNISSLVDQKGKKIQLGTIDPREIDISCKLYYRYIGSLTTPPCSEPVVWTINKKVRTVSINQVTLLRDAVLDAAENNARPLQPRNNRDILLYVPGLKSARSHRS